MTGLRRTCHTQDIARSLSVHIVSGVDDGELLHRVDACRCIPDLPQGVVFGAEAPQRVGGDAERAGSSHLVQDCDGVEEPDLVPDMRVVVVVGEVRVERIGIDLDLRFGVGCGLPRVLRRDAIDIEDFGLYRCSGLWLRLGVAAGSWSCGRRQSRRPVIAIAAQGEDDLLLWDNLEDLLQVIGEPILAGEGAGAGGLLVLVVIHQQQAVGVGSHIREVKVSVIYRRADVEPEVVRVKRGVEVSDEGLEAVERAVWNVLKVECDAAIAWVGSQKALYLIDEVGAGGRVGEEWSDGVGVVVVDDVVIVDEREDFGVDAVGSDLILLVYLSDA